MVDTKPPGWSKSPNRFTYILSLFIIAFFLCKVDYNISINGVSIASLFQYKMSLNEALISNTR